MPKSLNTPLPFDQIAKALETRRSVYGLISGLRLDRAVPGEAWSFVLTSRRAIPPMSDETRAKTKDRARGWRVVLNSLATKRRFSQSPQTRSGLGPDGGTVDAPDLKFGFRKEVRVRVPLRAPVSESTLCIVCTDPDGRRSDDLVHRRRLAPGRCRLRRATTVDPMIALRAE